MDNLWPIAFGLAAIGVIWAIVMGAKHNADRDDARHMNALDAAISTSKESENSQLVKARAEVYLAFLEGKAETPEPEPDAHPYQLHTHEAS